MHWRLLATLTLGVLAAAAAHAAQPPECTGWQACLALAVKAEAADEQEHFHDLAWRAMQQRGRLDPDVMIVLARAQARSGRPHDSLVMLRRIADLGVAPIEARTSDAFERTRRLPGWPEVEELIDRAATAGEPAETPDATAPGVKPPTAATNPVTASRSLSPPTVKPPVEPGPAAVAPAASPPAKPSPPAASWEEVLRFRAPDLVPAGLAYDVASARFLFGNRFARSVMTISERLDAAVDLVRSASAGFHDVLAIAIDARRGDLWVASAAAGDASGPSAAALHKLQLVSGRPLQTIPIDAGDRATRFTALAVDTGGAVFALDGAESRLWRLRPGKKELDLVAELELDSPMAMTLDGAARRAYIAHADGLSRLSLADGRTSAVDGPEEAGLPAVESLAWHGGSLIASVRVADLPRRLVRLRLNRAGTKVIAVDTLDPDVATCRDRGIVTVSNDDAYYLAGDAGERSAQDCEIVVRKVTLR